MKCEPKVALICKRYGVTYKRRPLKFGYERLEIECESYAVLSGLRDEIRKVKGTAVNSTAYFRGEFTGAVLVMDDEDEADLLGLLHEEMDRVEDWWQRYHVADAETSRLMACGEIA